MTRFLQDEDGLIHVEHAVLLAVLVVAGLALWAQFGGKIRTGISSGNTAFASVLGASGGGSKSGPPTVW